MSVSKSDASYEVLSPWAEADPKPLRGISPRLADLAGKRIGLLCNSKRAAPLILNVAERLLKERYPAVETSWFYARSFSVSSLEPDRKDEFEDWINGIDAVVAAVGDWGACTKYLVYDAIFIEEHNTPTVTFAFEYFINDAMSAASSRGMPVVRVVPETIVSECTVREDIEAAITAAFDNMVAALTKPLTADEKSPQRREPENPPRLIFRGSLEEVNRFFYQRGWTDGLPIIPPTEEAVAEMLTGTDLPADHLVEKLEPRLGKATVERIAINAVMAGCLPTSIPLLIAGVHALAASPVCGMMAASTGSFAPFWLVNGPVTKDLHINSSYGATSPGNIANATIGLALGLITKNIRGVRRQIEDMGVLGNPGKYSWVAAEDEENSPWEPLHVERGFSKEDSAVTLTFPQSFQQMIPFGTDDRGILATVIGSITPARMGTFALLLTPAHARTFANRGWSKPAIKEYIIKNARIPDDYYTRLGLSADEPFDRGNFMGPGVSPEIFRPDPRAPDPVQVYVFGGFGSWLGFMQGGPSPITKKIELPKNWDKLVDRYRNIVPTYVRY